MAWSKGDHGSSLAHVEHSPAHWARAGGAVGRGWLITSEKYIKVLTQSGVFINKNEPAIGLNFQPLGD